MGGVGGSNPFKITKLYFFYKNLELSLLVLYLCIQGGKINNKKMMMLQYIESLIDGLQEQPSQISLW